MPEFSQNGMVLRIAVEFVEGYRYAQVFAPKDQQFIALEPMTAPTNALISGKGLSVVKAGGTFRAIFRVNVKAAP